MIYITLQRIILTHHMWLTSQTRFFNFLFWRFSLFLCRLFSTHAREDVEVRHMWKLHGGVGAQHRFHLMVYKKGYRTESDCAIETAQWRNNKGLGRKLREMSLWKWKLALDFFFGALSETIFFLCKFKIVSDDNQIRSWGSIFAFLSSSSCHETESVSELHERRETSFVGSPPRESSQ